MSEFTVQGCPPGCAERIRALEALLEILDGEFGYMTRGQYEESSIKNRVDEALHRWNE